MAGNRGCAYRWQIGPDAAGLPLLTHLIERYTHSDADAWALRVAGGEVTIDDVTASGGEILRRGQVCVWHRPRWEEPDVPLSFDVVYEDTALLVVNKPPGLPTLPAGGFLAHTLLALVRAQYPEASPVHRLGRFTSGLGRLEPVEAARRGRRASQRRPKRPSCGQHGRAGSTGQIECG